MKETGLMLSVLLAASLSSDTSAQPAPPAFQDSYVDVNGVRLH